MDSGTLRFVRTNEIIVSRIRLSLVIDVIRVISDALVGKLTLLLVASRGLANRIMNRGSPALVV